MKLEQSISLMYSRRDMRTETEQVVLYRTLQMRGRVKSSFSETRDWRSRFDLTLQFEDMIQPLLAKCFGIKCGKYLVT